MPKSFNNLFPQIANFENLFAAWETARRSKRRRPDVAAFERHLEPNLLRIEQQLLDGSYRPGRYRSFFIREPKRRKISAAPFRDRVVHHALVRVIEPIFESRFSNASYACRVGKGTHRAADHAQALLRRHQYVLKADIAQFFPSIDHGVLDGLLARHIACRRTLDLCRRIMASGDGILASEYTLKLFPGDDLFAALRPRGLPIGNLTSGGRSVVTITAVTGAAGTLTNTVLVLSMLVLRQYVPPMVAWGVAIANSPLELVAAVIITVAVIAAWKRLEYGRKGADL